MSNLEADIARLESLTFIEPPADEVKTAEIEEESEVKGDDTEQVGTEDVDGLTETAEVKGEDMEDVGTKGVDAMMFDTVEEAVEAAGQLGCEGTHTGDDGKYMPCATHEVLTEAMASVEVAPEVEETKDEAEEADEKADEVEVVEIEDVEEKADEEEVVEPSTTSLLDQMDDAEAKNVEDTTVSGILGQMIDGETVNTESDTDVIEVKDETEEEESEEVEEKSLCGMTRDMVADPCEDCRGGCAPAGDMPGLAAIEAKVLVESPEGSEIIASGYSTHDDVYVVNVKGGDGVHREVFRGGDGSEYGYFVVSQDAEYDENRVKTIDRSEAAEIALAEVKGGEVVAVDSDQDFFGSPTFAVEIEGEVKSFDVYVAVDGEVLGFTEYATETVDPEVKELEAELELKRMYSRERRMELAESGEAMEDGSFPIVDAADLQNAITAIGRAEDQEAARTHIMKRAEALEATELIPDEWTSDGNPEEQAETEEEAPAAPAEQQTPPAPAASPVAANPDDEKSADDEVVTADMADLMAEFRDIADNL